MEINNEYIVTNDPNSDHVLTNVDDAVSRHVVILYLNISQINGIA